MSANELRVEALLRAHAPQAPDALRMGVLAHEPVRRPAPRRIFLVAAAAAALAVGAAVVHGIVGSGSAVQRTAGSGGAPADVTTTATWGTVTVNGATKEYAPVPAQRGLVQPPLSA